MQFTDEKIRNLFGNEAAEDEEIDRLKEYYVKNDTYNSMKSEIPLYVLVGHKGTGKSALLTVLKNEYETEGNIAISVQPNDIEIEYDGNLLHAIRDWKDGLSKLIFKRLLMSISRVNDDNWVGRFNALVLSVIGEKTSDLEKQYINDQQFNTLFKNALFAEKRIVICIDDLDRGWKNTDEDIMSISALLNAVRDLSRQVTNLRFRIALRSDVYYAVRTSDESTDKIESSVLWNSWTNHEILVMLIKRIETSKGRKVDDYELIKMKQNELQHFLFDVFEDRFNGKGHWDGAPIYQVLMSLIRKRPRDLIKLCTMSAKQAKKNGHTKISTADLETIFNEYSTGRLQDTINEYISEFPQIENLLLKMKPTRREVESGRPCLYTMDELTKKIRNIMEQSDFKFADKKRRVSETSLAAFMYKINFLTARNDRNNNLIQRIYYDENKYLINSFRDFGYKYEIHPAYRWALQPDCIDDLFYQIELSED